MLEKIKGWWNGLDEGGRQKYQKRLVYALCGLMLLGVGVSKTMKQYQDKKKAAEQEQDKTAGFKSLQAGAEDLNRRVAKETMGRVGKVETEVGDIKKDLGDFRKLLEDMNQNQATQKEETIKELDRLRSGGPNKVGGPPPTSPNATPGNRDSGGGWAYPAAPGGQMGPGGQPQPLAPIRIGGISHSKKSSFGGESGDRGSEGEKKTADDKERAFYLPSNSLLKGDLLTGFTAETAVGGKSEPIRFVFRINDLAILPNSIKSKMQGCMVGGEGFGKLSDERAHVRTLTLSCIALDGSAVIDEAIEGYVTDGEDGKVGLKGVPVSKMDQHLWRAFFAGALEGLGSAVNESAYDTNNTALGSTQVLNSTNVGKAALGSGIKSGSKELSKFYMDLAKQTLPVIEGGAGRKVVIVIQKGVDLKIRKKCLDGINGCEEQKENNEDHLATFNNL